MTTEHKISAGVRGLIISVDIDRSAAGYEQIARMSDIAEKKFGIPVMCVSVPVQVHTVPDLQYGIRRNGFWLTQTDGKVISGTKAEMCAQRDNSAIYNDTVTVEPLPTE